MNGRMDFEGMAFYLEDSFVQSHQGVNLGGPPGSGRSRPGRVPPRFASSTLRRIRKPHQSGMLGSRRWGILVVSFMKPLSTDSLSRRTFPADTAVSLPAMPSDGARFHASSRQTPMSRPIAGLSPAGAWRAGCIYETMTHPVCYARACQIHFDFESQAGA